MSWCTQELSIWCHQYCTASQQEMRKTAWGNSFDWPVKHFNFRPINENQLIHWQDSEREALAHLPDIIGCPFLTVSRKPWPTYLASWPFLKASRKPWSIYPSSQWAGSPGPLTRHRRLTLPQSKQEALAHLPDIAGWPFLKASRKPWSIYPSSQWAGSPGPLTRHRRLTLPQSKQEALAHLPDIAGWPFLKASRKPWSIYPSSHSQWEGSPGPLTRRIIIRLVTSLADPSSKQAGSPGPFTLPHSEQEALAHLPDIAGWPFLKASRKPWPTYQTSLADPSSKQAGSPGPLTRHRWLTLPQSGHCLLSPAPLPACWPCCPQHAESEPWPPRRTPACWKILCQWGQENACN